MCRIVHAATVLGVAGLRHNIHVSDPDADGEVASLVRIYLFFGQPTPSPPQQWTTTVRHTSCCGNSRRVIRYGIDALSAASEAAGPGRSTLGERAGAPSAWR